MRRHFISSGLIIYIILLTSCVDAFHYVALKNGNIDMTVKYTVQKMLLQTLASFSGEEIDYSEFTEMGDEMFDELSGMEAQIIPIDTELEIGAKIVFTGPLEGITNHLGTESPFILIPSGNGYFIRIPGMAGEDDDVLDEGAAAFLASSKYTLLIDLTGDLKSVSHIGIASGKTSQEMEDLESLITVEIFENMAYVEIPMMILMSSTEDIIFELY